MLRRWAKARPVSNWYGLLALLALVVAGATLAQVTAGSLLRDVGLSQSPPSDTELAFSHPQALPTALRSVHGAIAVSFDIRNVSDASRTYRWRIELVRSRQRRTVAAGVVSTPSQGGARVDKTVATSCAGGRLQVVARLTSPAESIDFWVACAPGSRRAS